MSSSKTLKVALRKKEWKQERYTKKMVKTDWKTWKHEKMWREKMKRKKQERKEGKERYKWRKGEREKGGGKERKGEKGRKIRKEGTEEGGKRNERGKSKRWGCKKTKIKLGNKRKTGWKEKEMKKERPSSLTSWKLHTQSGYIYNVKCDLSALGNHPVCSCGALEAERFTKQSLNSAEVSFRFGTNDLVEPSS